MERCNKPKKGPCVMGAVPLDVCPRHGVRHHGSTPKPEPTPKPRPIPKRVMASLLRLESAVWDECGTHLLGELIVTTSDGVRHTVNLPWYS